MKTLILLLLAVLVATNAYSVNIANIQQYDPETGEPNSPWDGMAVQVQAQVYVIQDMFEQDEFFIKDETGGIRCIWDSELNSGYGDFFGINAVVSHVDGEIFLDMTGIDFELDIDDHEGVDPAHTTISAVVVGYGNVGHFVRVIGTIQDVQEDSFILGDGGDDLVVHIDSGTGISLNELEIGQPCMAQGAVRKSGSDIRLYPRMQTDIVQNPPLRPYTVYPDGSGDFATIQEAVNYVVRGDTINLACGTFYEHNIHLRSNVVITAIEPDLQCVTIDAQGQGFIFNSPYGWREDYLSFIGIRFINSDADNTGALRATDLDTIVLDRCIFKNNQNYGDGAGAFYCNDCWLYAYDCSFSGNHGDTAALSLEAASLYLERCVFIDNVSASFGVIVSEGGAIEACTITRNTCAELSDPVLITYGTDIINSIIADNVGASIYDSPHWDYEIICTDIYGNTGGDWIGNYADMLGQNGNISENPQFCDPDNDDFSISSESPCGPINNPECGLIGAMDVGCGPPSDVEQDQVLMRYKLGHAIPNPFNPSTTISFNIPTAALVRLNIYSLDGRLVAGIIDNELQGGSHSVTWGGTDSIGRAVPSGTYIYRLQTGDYSESKRMMLIR